MNTQPLCPQCKSCSWILTENQCDVCGDHPAYRCENCYETADYVWDDDLFRLIEKYMESK